ncbi:MAG: (Fe-S)-binding protein [Longimicrobiales bacterium]
MKNLLAELLEQEDKLLNCVHCGFCLPACPTYTRLWDEADSPRGRLHFMRAVVDGRLPATSRALSQHLDRCLGCRACESVCPSGVEYGHLLEAAREVLARARPRSLLDRLFPRVMGAPLLLAPAMFVTRALRATGIPALAAVHLPSKGVLAQARLGLGMVAATMAPRHLGGGRGSAQRTGGSGTSKAEGFRERSESAGPPGLQEGEPRRSLGGGTPTALLQGCVQEGLLPRVNRATARVLEANGYRVVPSSGQRCCGAIHAHTGDLEGARRLARRNIRAFEASGARIIAVNAAGCGAIMKEYGHLLAADEQYAQRAADMSARVKDVSELLGREGLRVGDPLPLKVTYDAPCHLLHAQKVSHEPLFLLRSIPELRVLPLAGQEECCGGAGVYGIMHPELGGAIGRDKVSAVLETGADLVATGNPGCLMQIGAGLWEKGRRVDVVHPVELLDESYRRAGLYSG